MGLETEIMKTAGLRLTLKSGQQKTITFDEEFMSAVNKSITASSNRILHKNLLFHTFINASKAGYLDKFESTFFGLGEYTWKPRFCVLSNVGLLIFQDPHTAQNAEFVALADSKVTKIKCKTDFGFSEGHFAVKVASK